MSRRRRVQTAKEENSDSDNEDIDDESVENAEQQTATKKESVPVSSEKPKLIEDADASEPTKEVYSTSRGLRGKKDAVEPGKKKQEQIDPASVPKTGRFFLHDDRGSGGGGRGSDRSHRKPGKEADTHHEPSGAGRGGGFRSHIGKDRFSKKLVESNTSLWFFFLFLF
jgi:hypothetical protein